MTFVEESETEWSDQSNLTCAECGNDSWTVDEDDRPVCWDCWGKR